MMRRFMAVIAILVLGLTVVSPTGGYAAEPVNPAAETDALESDLRGDIAALAVLAAPPVHQNDCKGTTNSFGGSCSFYATQAAPGLSAPTGDLIPVRWVRRGERLQKTAIDPGFRPPIPVS